MLASLTDSLTQLTGGTHSGLLPGVVSGTMLDPLSQPKFSVLAESQFLPVAPVSSTKFTQNGSIQEMMGVKGTGLHTIAVEDSQDEVVLDAIIDSTDNTEGVLFAAPMLSQLIETTQTVNVAATKRVSQRVPSGPIMQPLDVQTVRTMASVVSNNNPLVAEESTVPLVIAERSASTVASQTTVEADIHTDSRKLLQNRTAQLTAQTTLTQAGNMSAQVVSTPVMPQVMEATSENSRLSKASTFLLEPAKFQSESTKSGEAFAPIRPFAMHTTGMVADSLQFTKLDNVVQQPTEQVIVKMVPMVREGGGKLSLQLEPMELGRVDIQLDISKDGTTKIVIQAERGDTLDLLRHDARSLERALQEAGIKADSQSMEFQLSSHQFREGNPQLMGASDGIADTVEEEIYMVNLQGRSTGIDISV